MADEARKISVQVQATQAISQLQKLGAALEAIGSAVGSSDAVLRNLDQQLVKIPGVASNASSAIARMKKEVQGLSSVQKSMSVTPVSTANGTGNIGSLNAQIRDNLRLAGSMNTVAAAASTTAATTPALSRGLAATGTATAAATRGFTSTAKSVDQLQNTVQQNALRYQLYDVAATLGIVGAAALTAGLAVTKAGIEWDKNFANVVRTSQITGTAVGWLKTQFLELQTLVPVTSADLANIATLGSQMGVNAAAIADFTKVTAQFSATSGLNVDESATALSRLNQLLPDVQGNYEKLASTILRTGVNAVATEAQITRGTSQIASMGQIAGMTTPEVVALSSAMSSLGFSPELQRSVITSSFSKILTATSEVTAKTEKFGAVLKMTGKEFQQAWREDAIGTFRNLLTTIASRGDAVSVLSDLGLASQRLTPNLLKLGQNSEVLNAALADTRDEWSKNTELTRQYGIISNTVSARLQILGQSWEALLVTLDDSDTVLKPLIDGLTGFLGMLRHVAEVPGVSAFASLGTAIVVLTGAVALGAAALAGMAAGYIAITNATVGLTVLTHGNTGATELNTAAVVGNNVARGAGTGVITAETGAVAANSVAMGANTAATTGAGAGLLKFTGGIIGALPSILKWTGIIGLAAAAVTGLVAIMATSPDWTHDLDKAFAGIDTVPETLKFDVNKIKKVGKEAEVEYQKAMDHFSQPEFKKFATPELFAGIKKARDDAQDQMRKPLWKDLEDSFLEMKNPADQLNALNEASKSLGMTTGELLKKLPGLSSVLGDNAEAAAEAEAETRKLDGAQQLWAVHLNTSDENLAKLESGVKSAAASFLDFGGALSDAYETDPKTGARLGGGFKEFTKTMDKQVADFENFYGKLGELVQRGGIQLATLFAEQGPKSMDALTDALKLSPEQLSAIEGEMSLAAFYASDAFANTFAQNNAILADVWTQSGHNPAAVKAFNDALSSTMKGGSIDPVVLADLANKFGIKLNVDMVPDVDQEQFDTATALLGAKVTPIKIPVTTNVGQGDFTVTNQIDGWIVEMEGHAITMQVDPNTDRGRQIIAAWRANEHQVPVELRAVAQTNEAAVSIDNLIRTYAGKRIPLSLYLNMPRDKNGRPINVGQLATGGMLSNGQIHRSNYPGYAAGTIFRGPGSGTSDSIIARVSDGEAITRARAVRYYGTKMMEDINNMRFPRYATGFTPSGIGGAAGPRQVINATVVQNYPTTRDPIKTLKQEAESVIAGIWA